MGLNSKILIRSWLMLLPALVIILAVSVAKAQSGSPSAQEEVPTADTASANNVAAENVPVFADYRGVRIGMTAEEVRAKLDRLKKGERQDYLVFSERESAQIYYDPAGKVIAISIDYFAK